MFKKIMLLIAALLLAVPLVSCGAQGTTNEQTFAQGLIKTMYDVDYNTTSGDKLTSEFQKYLSKDYIDAQETKDMLKDKADTDVSDKIVQHVENFKLVNVIKNSDGSIKIGANFIVNFVSGTDENFGFEAGKKYLLQTVITAKADDKGNLLAPELPDVGTPTEYKGEALPAYVPNLDQNADKDAVYGVQQKYYKFLYDVDYKTITPESGAQVYTFCTEEWKQDNSVDTGSAGLTDVPADTALADVTDAPTDPAAATTDASPSASASPKTSPTPAPSASDAAATASPTASDASDLPTDTSDTGAVTDFATTFYQMIQDQKIVDQFVQFIPVSMESQGVGAYLAKAYVIVKHMEGQGDYYTDANIQLGQTYCYLMSSYIVYQGGAWKFDMEDSMVFGGKYTGTLPTNLPGTNPDTDGPVCESAAKAFVNAETNIDYKVGKDKLNEHYTTMGTQGFIDGKKQDGSLDMRADEFIQGQVVGKLDAFEITDDLQPELDPLGGQKYDLYGSATIEFTAATPEYLAKNNLQLNKQYIYDVYMLMAFRDGQWKVDGFEMQPYDATTDENTGTDTTLPPDTAATSPSATPSASPTATPKK